ncbi:MAG TPA: FHA domain-containing protein [Solirubrobacteraceae bacterium]|nr:FHA domain-containing protein [Solirubrobacteraceae bacterium]
MDTFPDLGSLSDQELKDLIQQLTDEEVEVSYRRRILHGKIDILRAELVNRLRKKHETGEDVISGADVERLTDILSGRAGDPDARDEGAKGRRRMARHCPECGFVNAEGANYCSKCGGYLGSEELPKDSTTATYRVGETGELIPVELDEVVASEGAALVIRAGGGRVGESFPLAGERLTIGRRPDSDVFLDDVTVSRDHALLVARQDAYFLDDLGSLNGTYVNRHRIESHRLEDGDELQVGKYKLTFLQR